MDVLKIATKFAEGNPDFFTNFYGMVREYESVCNTLDLNREELPMSTKFFDQFDRFLEVLEEASNG